MNRTVVVGLGAVSEFHIEPVKRHATLYGVCDIVKEKADKIAKKNDCKAYYDYDEVIEDKNVDCVHILTPHYLHFPMAQKASLAGKKIVLEKPAVINTEEYKRLLETFEKNGTDCCIMLQNRYNNCISYMKENWNKLGLGRFLGLKGIVTWYRSNEYYSQSNWRGKYETEGGGLLINQSPHMIDLLCYFGGKVKEVKGTASHYFFDNIIEVEDTSEAVIFFENGVKALFYGTNGYVTNSPYDMEFVFEKGTVRYMYDKLYKITDGEMSVLCEDRTNEFKEKKYWGSSHDIVIKSFYSGGKYPVLKDYNEALTVIDYLIKKRR